MSTSTLPRHIAIVMDGNGRWAKHRHLPRIAGHKAGVKAVRETVKFCVEHHIEVLTLFAFSSENWRRPAVEVNHLMELFIMALEREATKLHKQNIQLRIIGDRARFDEKLQKQMANAENLTANNTGLKLLIAANYGGQWDITEACRRLAIDVQQGKLAPEDISAELIEANLVTADLPLPDLFIRTSGEQRISNFLIWQLSYAELYFTDAHWPDFDASELKKAVAFFANRERRFGHISEQLRAENHA
ncbi:MAG: isoprenyl transferase [Gammaproteobacteria bacterium]|nr:isoprenyl transferase [Gammaproteobacteria bacterium]